MTEKYAPSRLLTRKRADLNMDLRDMEDIGLPVNLTPVWPEMDTKSAAQLIDSAKKDIGKRMNGNEGRFLRAQLKALDYFYGKKDEAIDTKNKDNPLVDIIALIANVGDAKSASSTYQIAVEGTPKPIPLITKASREKKPEQRTFEVAPWGRKEHRTIARFSNQISTVLRGLNLLTEASKHHPLIIRSTIHEYSNNFGGGTHSVAGTAVGLLEIINNLDLLNDARFHSLSSELREVVFEEVKSYKELKEKYSYRVVDKRRFWYQGEVDTYARKKTNYVKVDGMNRIEVNRFPKFSFPTIKGWQRKSRERSKIIKEHRQLTLFNSIKRSAANFSEDNAIQAVSDDRLKKADLTEQKRNLEREQHGKLRRAWRKFVETEIDEGSNITKNEEGLVKDATNLILDYFVTDPALSQKAKANILANKNSGDKNFYYQIDSKALAKDYLFSWILALRNPYVAKGFEESLNVGGNLTRIEKDIILSTIGHLTHLTYDDAFPEKAAVLLNLIQQYSPANHEDAVRWLTNEGADTLFRTSLKESFTYLAELTNGKARNTSAEEIRRYFPASVTEELDILSKKNGSNGKNADIEIPYDFGVIYGISQILFNDSLMSLQKEVRKRLELEDVNSEISISYKLDDVLDLLRSKYASSHTSEKAKSIFNSILLLLNWNTVSNEDPIFTE